MKKLSKKLAYVISETYLCTMLLDIRDLTNTQFTMQTLYIAIRSRGEAPTIGLTITDIAEQLGVHRNSLAFGRRQVVTVKGWSIYKMRIEMTKSALGRPGNLPRSRNND
jgi:hypothetical protein